MRDQTTQMPSADWMREHFGIEDEDELRAVLADPTEMLALLDVVRAVDPDGMRNTEAETVPLARANASGAGRRRSTLGSVLE